MFLCTGLKAIGRLFKKLFTNKHVQEYASHWGETIAQIVMLLAFDSTQPGSAKIAQVVSILKNKAASEGKQAIDEITRFLAELEVAKRNNDPIKQILADGIDLASAAVEKFIDAGLIGDMLWSAAATQLACDLKRSGKKIWAETGRNLNLLIAAALAKRI